jgi:hypothetical protein
MKKVPQLPDLTHLDDKTNNKITNICNKITFSFDNEITQENYEIYFYVPYINLQINTTNENIQNTIKKLYKYNSKLKKFNVAITNENCETDLNCLDVAYDIVNITNYLKNIDDECSYCDVLNRSWECCGKFAPYMYIYFYLIFENNFKMYQEKSGLHKISKNELIYKFATIFYKVITGYASEELRYYNLMATLRNVYKIRIPNQNDDPDYWYLNETKYNMDTFKNKTSYMLTLCDEIDTDHHFFIYRCDDNIIINDSWTVGYGSRGPIVRIFKLEMFLNAINNINYVYANIKKIPSKDRKAANKMYNILMDIIFMIPYTENQIKGNSLIYQRYRHTEIRVVDPERINRVFDILIKNNNVGLTKYLYLGGKNKLKSKSKKVNKIRKNKTIKIKNNN